MMHWRMLFLHAVRLAFSLADASTGSNNAARMAMIAMTTSNSISVKPWVSLLPWWRREASLMESLVSRTTFILTLGLIARNYKIQSAKASDFGFANHILSHIITPCSIVHGPG